jgi:hypothetical protein
LSVAAAVEAVALVFAGAGVEWCDAGVAGELGVCAEAVDRADLAEQLRGAERDVEAWVKLVQVPAQPLLAATSLVNEVVAVVNQQLQLAQRLFAGTGTVELGFLERGSMRSGASSSRTNAGSSTRSSSGPAHRST